MRMAMKHDADADDDPPYMVIKTRDDHRDHNFSRSEPPQHISSVPGRGDMFGMAFQLGEEYEKKKKKLQQELRLDYRSFVSKKTDLKLNHPSTRPETLSLLFDERKSAQEKLRDERKKEYNLFLKEQEGLKSGVSKRQSSLPSKSSPWGLDTDPLPRSAGASPVLLPDHHQHSDDGFHDDPPPPARRGRSTPQEEDGGGPYPRRRRRQWEVGREARETPAVVVLRGGAYERRRPPRRRGRRKSRAEYSSEEEEEETASGEEEELEYGGKEYDQGTDGGRGGAGRREGRRKEDRADRRQRSRKEDHLFPPHQATRGGSVLKPRSATSSMNRPATDPLAMMTTERARSAAPRPRAEAVATGLAIGAVEGSEVAQMKKERYRLELLEQMAEKQRSKRREKDLDMRSITTGASDPEKKPDRFAQLGSSTPRYDVLGRGPPQGDQREAPGAEAPLERWPPPGRPRVGFSIPGSAPVRGVAGPGVLVPPLPPSTQEFHRSMSTALGEMAAPRPVGLPPLIPPALTDSYRTPYDEAYRYYGARDPLDPNLPYYNPHHGGGAGGGGGGYQPLAPGPLGGPPPLGPPRPPGGQQAAVSLAVLGVMPEERSGQTKASAMSYGEALKQQASP
ncbi:unnamed protein product [Gadus morhua 'NCC']